MNHLPSLPVVVAFLIASVASFSRIFDASKPFWSRFPGWFQVLAPAVVPALAAFGAALVHVQTGTDLTVAVVAFVGLLFPGAPSHRSSASLPSTFKPPILPLIAWSLCFGAIMILAGGCAEKLTPKTVLNADEDIARMLCGQFFSAKAGLSISDAERAFCDAQQLTPWLEQLVSAKQKAGVIASARAATAEGGDAGSK